MKLKHRCDACYMLMKYVGKEKKYGDNSECESGGRFAYPKDKFLC